MSKVEGNMHVHMCLANMQSFTVSYMHAGNIRGHFGQHCPGGGGSGLVQEVEHTAQVCSQWGVE